MDLPKRVSAKISNIFILTQKVVQLDLNYLEPADVTFKSGQFYSINVAEHKYRSYSIFSDSKDTKGFSIIAEVGHIGLGSNYIKTLKVGDTINMIGPAGRFALQSPYAPNLYFFATGTGISPFISMLHKLNDLKYAGSIEVFFGIRREQDMFFEDKLDAFTKSFNNFKYKTYVSQPVSVDFQGNKGRITTVVKDVKTSNAHYYLCGNPAMIADVSELLTKRGISKDTIFHEAFTYAK